jgi:hypothetical protein
MVNTQIRFPLLAIDRQGLIQAFRDREKLETCNTLGLKNGYYIGLLLIDPSGQCWEVLSATRIANVTPWRPWFFLFPRQIRVRLDVVKIKTFQLHELKERVCQAIDQLPHFWEAAEDPEDTKARVRNFPTIESLITMFED